MSFFSDSVSALDASCLDSFGQEMTYRQAADLSNAITATGIEISANEREEQKTFRVVFFRAQDLGVDPVRGDRVEIGSIEYTVFDINPDEEGGVFLTLQRNP